MTNLSKLYLNLNRFINNLKLFQSIGLSILIHQYYFITYWTTLHLHFRKFWVFTKTIYFIDIKNRKMHNADPNAIFKY